MINEMASHKKAVILDFSRHAGVIDMFFRFP